MSVARKKGRTHALVYIIQLSYKKVQIIQRVVSKRASYFSRVLCLPLSPTLCSRLYRCVIKQYQVRTCSHYSSRRQGLKNVNLVSRLNDVLSDLDITVVYTRVGFIVGPITTVVELCCFTHFVYGSCRSEPFFLNLFVFLNRGRSLLL